MGILSKIFGHRPGAASQTAATDAPADASQVTRPDTAGLTHTDTNKTQAPNSKGTDMSYQDILNKRRSVYALNNQLPVSEEEAVKTIEDAIVASPSAFNVQSAQAIILLGDEHKNLWNGIVHDTLEAIVPADAFEQTAQKLALFAGAYGTVLFFENQDAVDQLKEQFPTYADAFDGFAAHAQGIAQVNVWNALAEKNIGANLQHYNPLIDDAVKARYEVPESWNLVAQLNFGGIAAPAGEQQRKPAAERVRVVR